MMDLKEKTSRLFKQRFGAEPSHCFRAPGRVNLIGEHTDYNDGFVLPAAINYQTVIAAEPRSDGQVLVIAADFDGQESNFSLAAPIEPDSNAPWSNYVRGVAWALQQQGHKLQGLNMVVSGNVPQGAGLSSSASLEVAVGVALSQFNRLNLDGKAIALTGRQAVKRFCGCQLRHYGPIYFRAGQQGPRPAHRLPPPDLSPCFHAGRNRNYHCKQQRKTRSGGQRIQHPPPRM